MAQVLVGLSGGVDSSGALKLTMCRDDRDIAKLATIDRGIYHEWEYSSTWKGSTKRLKCGAKFRVLAGVDLAKNYGPDIFLSPSDPFTLFMGDVPAEIIAIEPIGEAKILEEDNGWWNRIQKREGKNDITKAMAWGLQSVRKQMENNQDLLDKAKDRFFDIIQSKISDKDPNIKMRRRLQRDNKTWSMH